MNEFTQYLFPENIFLDLHVPRKFDLIAQIALLIERQHQISRLSIYEGLCARERLCSTGLGQGIAIPHAKIRNLRQPIVAFVRLAVPIEFDSPDEKPVSQLFVLLLPSETNDHLQMFADIAGLLCDRRFQEKLNAATDLRAVHACFQNACMKQRTTDCRKISLPVLPQA
jgi:PTS system nitrogen regulatory IIA component